MSSGDYTVILARRSGAARKYRFSTKLVATLAVAGMVLLTGFSLSGLHYFHMWKKSASYSHLSQERDQLVRENESFRVSARQLADQLSLLEVRSRKLEMMAGMDEEGVAGVGGPSLNAAMIPDLDKPQNLQRYFASLSRKRISLQSELNKLQDYYTTRRILISSTPSIMPVQGYPSSRFGFRRDPFTGERDYHPGLDISAPKGAAVVAAADGKVSFSGRKRHYGRLVTIEHRFGLSSAYGHLSQIVAKDGQVVKRGDTIGYVGSSGRASGNHVHYEVRLDNRPMDPLRFIRK